MHGENSQGWDGLQEFQETMYKYQIALAFPGEVIAKMNR
jgi:hypothetical protein